MQKFTKKFKKTILFSYKYDKIYISEWFLDNLR